MDTTPSPRSSSQGDVEMDDGSGTLYDDPNVGYSQADEYETVVSEGSGSMVPETQAGAFIERDLRGQMVSTRCELFGVGASFLIDVLDNRSTGPIRKLWPQPEDGNGWKILIDEISGWALVKLELNLSHLFNFIHSGHAFLRLCTLVPWVDKECAAQLEELKDLTHSFAPSLDSLEIKYYAMPGSPEDVTQWAVAHGVPLLLFLYRGIKPQKPFNGIEARRLNITFNHITSKIPRGHARRLAPIKAALENEGITCTAKKIDLNEEMPDPETCNLMEKGFASEQ